MGETEIKKGEEGKYTREVIQVRIEKFDIGERREEIKEAISKLDAYLEMYKPKGRRGTSKHSLEGPAGKLLSVMKASKLTTRDALVGQIASIHENTGNRLTVESAQKLEQAVDAVQKALGGVPETKRLKVLSEIDYGLFFVRKKKLLEYLAKIQKDFANFLREKYGDIRKLNEAWKLTEETSVKPLRNFEEVPPPTVSFEKRVSKLGVASQDLKDFFEARKIEVVEEEEEVAEEATEEEE
ncbi:MAG: beta-galactosidase [Thermoproteota archaeon]